jgi:hypothetical protein
VLAGGEDDAAQSDLVRCFDRLPDRDERVCTDLAVRSDVVRADVVEVIDLVPRDELVDVDGSGRLDSSRSSSVSSM